MKTIKSILIAATLVSASFVSALSAQEAQPAEKHQFKVAVGDSVMIKRECQKYLTGETPSVWVWDKVHTVRQLGTKRFPDGVLLMNIYSWICEDCLVNVSGHAQEAAERAAAEQAADRAAFEADQARKAAGQKASGEEQAAEASAAPLTPAEIAAIEAEKAAQEAAAAAEEARLAAEQAAIEQEAAEQAIREAAQAEEARKAAEQARGDSIRMAQLKLYGKYDRFTIGVRGGAAGLLHQVKAGNWNCGFDALLDLQYAHYWTKEGRPVDLGLIVGIGVGYSRSGMQAAVDTSYTVSTTDGNIDYTLKADQVKEHDGQIQLEVPLMFSLIHQNGLFFNIGPKFMIPVYTPYSQNIVNPQIDAYFPTEGVNVSNEVITGMLKNNQLTNTGSDNGNQFSVNVMLTAEIGYEWVLNSGNSLGLGAYANYCVYNNFKNNGTVKSLMDVTAPTGSSAASVNVLSATKTYANGLGYFDAGVKLAYHFNFPKKRKFVDSKLF